MFRCLSSYRRNKKDLMCWLSWVLWSSDLIKERSLTVSFYLSRGWLTDRQDLDQLSEHNTDLTNSSLLNGFETQLNPEQLRWLRGCSEQTGNTLNPWIASSCAEIISPQTTLWGTFSGVQYRWTDDESYLYLPLFKNQLSIMTLHE